jgi:hypothetical protein
MEINRRNFMQTVGAGAASLGLAGAIPDAIAQAGRAATPRVARRKMVIRADDIGMSNVCNIGTF